MGGVPLPPGFHSCFENNLKGLCAFALTCLFPSVIVTLTVTVTVTVRSLNYLPQGTRRLLRALGPSVTYLLWFRVGVKRHSARGTKTTYLGSYLPTRTSCSIQSGTLDWESEIDVVIF
ncbi:hypothetical protein QBC41DRAFT_41416 [Cercophora samala]|uniref:Uncharacterized protein n=1 Tax=Cercophora samala TaxID=330535 RepID=A0AA39YXQ1_9PEZI|nr:hypothetical protein QBC41DRAFT_41416 [Cercophora samala]